MIPPRFTRAAMLLTVLAVPSVSHAEQFVLFDVTFTYTKENADNAKPSKSHYYVKGDKLNKDRPRDWTAPVDYRNGTVHIRAEVIEKPEGGARTTWTICYIPNKGRKNGYGCTGTQLYREKGVYERDVSMKEFWENDSIIWSEGIKQIDLVIKDDSGGNGHAHRRKDPEKFFPTKMRVTVIQVSAGSKYDPSLVPNLPKGTGAVEERKDGPLAEIKKVSNEPATCCGNDLPRISPDDKQSAPDVRSDASGGQGRSGPLVAVTYVECPWRPAVVEHDQHLSPVGRFEGHVGERR